MTPPEKENTDRLNAWLSFLKFFLGSVVLSTLALIINSNLKKRELENREMDLVGKYIEYALTKEVGDRKRFSEYFATVIRSNEQRERWQAYDSLVTVEYQAMLQELKKQDSLKMEAASEAKRRKENVVKGTDGAQLSETEKQQLIEEIEREYKDQITELENQISATEAKLKVTPIDELPSGSVDQLIPFHELKEDDLAHLIVDFMERYEKDCFNAARVKYFGGRKKNFQSFQEVTVEEIEHRLESLFIAGVLEKGECRTKELFSFSDFDDPDLIRFRQ